MSPGKLVFDDSSLWSLPGRERDLISERLVAKAGRCVGLLRLLLQCLGLSVVETGDWLGLVVAVPTSVVRTAAIARLVVVLRDVEQ